MTRGAREVDKAVSRTLRETLNTLQRTAEELHQALHDLVAACASTRPTNALPPILRAHTAAASLAASLEVLSRFVASSTQGTGSATQQEEEEEVPASPARSRSAAERPAKTAPPAGRIEAPSGSQPSGADPLLDVGEDLSSVEEPATKDLATAGVHPRIDSPPAQTIGHGRASDLGKHGESLGQISATPTEHLAVNPIEELPAASASFDISTLAPEEQDLHRRANRVAKVSMQDIKMLRPNDVRLGCEHKDICLRLRDDIEKAHKEYDRRFQSILVHPVDYFYDWMVEILGEGDPQALGEYPYPSPVLRR
jgi:uncharacterized damage-inducible protein DinB